MAVHFEYQGKHYEFADGTEPAVAKQKIQAFLGEQPAPAKEESSLLPDFSLDKALEGGKRLITEDIPNMFKDIVGANEAAANVGTGFTGGALGGFVEGGQGILDSMRDGTFGTRKGVKQTEEKFVKGMDRYTYEPRTERGKEMIKDVIDPVMHHLPSLVGAMPQLEAAAAVRKIKKMTAEAEGKSGGLLDRFKKETVDPDVQAFAQKRAKQEAQQPMPTQQQELPLDMPNQFGMRPGEMVLDENGIPIRQDLSLDAQTVARQGDLFEGGLPYESPLRVAEEGPSKRNGPDRMIGEVEEQAKLAMQDVEGLREGEQVRAGTYPEQVPDNSINWKSPKQMEIEQLWEEKQAAEQAEQQAAKETAWERAEAEKAPLELEPEQRSVEIEKPGERTTYRPNSVAMNALRKKQGGAIDPDVFLKDFPEFVKSTVKDAAGKLKVLYHGTQAKRIFDVFDPKAQRDWEGRRTSPDAGVSLAFDPKTASGYAQGENGRVMPVYVNAEKVWTHKTPNALKHVEQAFLKKWGDTPQTRLELAEVLKRAKTGHWFGLEGILKELNELHGYDAFEVNERGNNNLIVLNPNKIISATSPKLGQTGFGKSQRGSVGWFGKDTFEAYAEKIKKQFPDATPEEIKASWEEKQAKQKQQQVEKTVGNIAPSLKENLTAYKDVGKEDALAALKTSPDHDRPNLGGLRNTVLSRGRLGVEKLKNEGVKSALAHMIGLRDTGKIRANEVLHGDRGVLRSMRKLEKFFGPGRAWEVIRQRLEGQFNPKFEFKLDKDQMKIKEQLDKIFDDIHAQMEQITGKKIHKIPNYFPSMFYGDFVSEVRDSGGRLVAYITEKSAGKTKEAVQHVLNEMGEGFAATEPKYRKEMLNDRFKGRAGLAQHFEAMLDLLSSDDPVVQRAQQSVQNAVAKRAMDTRRVKDRLKFKAGVEGAEGQKGWKSDKENYYAAKDVLENYVRAFEDWKANMETSKFLKEIQDTMPDKKNTYNILQDYFDDMRAVKDANGRMATQIDNAMSNALGHSVGSALTGTARWTANNLTKLWLGFWNPAAMAQNVLQPVHSIAKLVDLASYGGSKDILSPIIMGFAKSLVDGISIASNGAFKTNLTERAKYLKDFEVIKPGLIEARDRTKMGHVLEKNVIAGGQMVSEAFARTTTFNIFETYLEKSGYSKDEAYSLAKNLTHDYMVNYEGYAKAGIVGNTGIAGEMAGRLQSFKINQFTQLANYIQTLKQTKNPAPLATAIAMSVAMAGVSGMIGMDIAEGIYGGLVKMGFVDPRTRSPRQMAMDLGGAAAFGIPTAATGKWLSGSLTTNLVGDMSWRNIAPIFAGVFNAGEAIIPTTWKAATTGLQNVPDSEKANALNAVVPTVFRGRVEDALLTDKEGRISSPHTGEVMYKKGPQDDNLLSKFTNIRSKERGETVARKALLIEQEKNIKAAIKGKTENLQKLFDEGSRRGKQLDPKHITKQFQDLLDYGNDPNQTVEAINQFIIKNHLGDWFQQQLLSGNITLNNVQQKLRAMEEKERIGK